jgi:hypothetical protein
MELKEANKIGEKLAEYFVCYCSEGEHYVSLIDHLREAKTRSEVVTMICILLRYGKVHVKQPLEAISQRKIEELYQFIGNGEITEVSRFHAALISNISMCELENMRGQERYLLELLT